MPRNLTSQVTQSQIDANHTCYVQKPNEFFRKTENLGYTITNVFPLLVTEYETR
jgi:hypothetical protein